MPSIAVAIIAPVVVLLAHYKYIDLWFRDKGGLRGYWIQEQSRMAQISKAFFLITFFGSPLIVWEDYRILLSSIIAITFLIH